MIPLRGNKLPQYLCRFILINNMLCIPPQQIGDFNSKLQNQQLQLQQQKQQIQQQQLEMQQLQHKLATCTSNVAFMAAIATSRFTRHELTIPQYQTVVYDNTQLNNGGSYDNHTGVFTCVVAGLYFFQAHAMNSDSDQVALNMVHNSFKVTSLYGGDNDQVYEADSVSAVMDLKAGDTVKMVTSQVSTFYDKLFLQNSNVFSGHLIKAAGCQP